MRTDHRLSRMLHVLIHMKQLDGMLTSQTIAGMLETSPAVVRRTMAGLRDRGLVGSEKGHGGGWRLLRALDDISMLDIYEALGEPTLFALGPSREHPDCLVERAVDERLSEAFLAAAAELRRQLEATDLGTIRRDVEIRSGGLTCAVGDKYRSS